jgi:hypothetical protein
MTGSLPGFVDVIRNLNSPVLLEDNVLRQAKAAGKRIIFYGDETWVKLFPKHFVEYDGTTSFFVSDYIEVCLSVSVSLCHSVSLCVSVSLSLSSPSFPPLFPSPSPSSHAA